MPHEYTSDALLEKLKDTLRHFSLECHSNFSGLGLVVYDTLGDTLRCDLRPKISCPSSLSLGSSELNRFLRSISVPTHPLHDGFHFIDKTGKLTHVAQYFVPDFVEGIVPNEKHGVRVHSAICGSFMKGILFTAVICSNGVAHLFKRGESISLDADLSNGHTDASTTRLEFSSRPSTAGMDDALFK